MICSFDECEKEFEPHRHNQKYCSSECCRDATNKRIRNKYQEARERLGGKIRICSSEACDTILNRYTEGDVCGRCLADEMVAQKELLRKRFL